MKIKNGQQLPTLAKGWRTGCAELYAPPRIKKIASDMGLCPAWVLDFTVADPEDGMPWDFTEANKRNLELVLLEQDRLLLLLASPLCGAFDDMNNIICSKMKPTDIHIKPRAATQHVRFALELCPAVHRGLALHV